MVLAATRLSTRVQSNIGLIRAGVNQGLSSDAIQGLIRSTGQAGIRRQELLQGIRHVSGIAESATAIRSTRLDRLPDPSRIQIARGPMISNFSYEVRVGPRFLSDGSLNRRHITIRSDTNLRPQEILDAAQEAIEQAPEDAKSGELNSQDQMTVVGARRKG